MLDGGLIFGVSWLWYLIGTVGIGGTIALAVLAPATLASAIPMLLRFFFGTRVGVGLLSGSLAFMAADIHRSTKDAAWWKSEKASMVEAARKRDTKIAEDTAEEVRKEMADLAVSETKTDAAVKEFADAPPVRFPETPARAVDPLAITDADADRLCIIATGRPCQRTAARHEGAHVPLPKPRPKGAHTTDRWKQLPAVIRRGAGNPE